MQLTVAEAAHLLQVSEETIYKWIRVENLPALLFNGQFYFNQVRLVEWAHGNHIAVAVESSPDLPSLESAFQPDNLLANIAGATIPEVLQQTVERLPISNPADREFLYQMLLTRKQFGITAFGNGIGIPRARSPIVLPNLKPSIVLSYLRTPFQFTASDHIPLHALFLFISPTFRIHLHWLSRLGRILMDAQFSELVRKQADFQSVRRRLQTVESSLKSDERTIQ
ncbi:MAG: PTS sugar transporter subunit IIA [Acidobacteria bacterium]|nr:PTS sugar transporter subunit IIA [Acidobacteriota bacterium]